MQPELNQLLALRAALPRGPGWRSARPIAASGSGRHRVSLPIAAGRGLLFAESRPYQRGDDVRSIDWKVTARQGRPHTKVFETERERPLWIVVDQGASMQFGSLRMFKSVLAAHAAAWLAWSGNAGGDRVGGVVVDDCRARVLPPRAGDDGVLALLDALCRPVQPPASSSPREDLVGGLARTSSLLRTGDRVFVISDFYALDVPSAALQLEEILGAIAVRCELLLLHVSDPLEAEPPPPDFYPLVRVDGSGWLNLTDPATRHAWRTRFAQRLDRLQALARLNAWPLLPLSTADDMLMTLYSLGGGR